MADADADDRPTQPAPPMPERAGRRATDALVGPTPGAVQAIHDLDRRLVRRWLIVVVGLLLLGGWATRQQVQANQRAKATRHLAAETRTLAAQTRTLAAQTRHLAARNHALTIQIQQQRYNTALTNCLDQDARHAATERRLKAGFSTFARTATPAQRRQQATSYTFTIGLINALAPSVKDCAAKARAVIGDGHKTTGRLTVPRRP